MRVLPTWVTIIPPAHNGLATVGLDRRRQETPIAPCISPRPVITMEQHLTARHPELGGALTVNVPGRRQTKALLIEPAPPSSTGSVRPTTTTAEQASLIEKIWPSIAEANTSTTTAIPAHARIDKALILVLTATTAPNRPLLRDSNGAANAEQQYADELAALWANADFGPLGGDGGGGTSSSSAEPPSDRDSIAQFVQESVSAVTSWPHEDEAQGHHQHGPTFFERGMDSLVALQLARVLRRGLRCPGLGLSTVYCNPTVSQLTSAVFAAVEEAESGGPVGT